MHVRQADIRLICQIEAVQASESLIISLHFHHRACPFMPVIEGRVLRLFAMAMSQTVRSLDMLMRCLLALSNQ